MKCKICNKETKNPKYCSRKCFAATRGVSSGRIRTVQHCVFCGEQLRKKCGKKYCSHKCQWSMTQKRIIDQWKLGVITGHSNSSAYSIRRTIRNYLFEKYNSKCSKCWWSEVNKTTGKIPLEVNHIDGNPANSVESNLELICPNCHSLTSNFRSLNKNSIRKHR